MKTEELLALISVTCTAILIVLWALGYLGVIRID